LAAIAERADDALDAPVKALAFVASITTAVTLLQTPALQANEQPVFRSPFRESPSSGHHWARSVPEHDDVP
jgi:hypothetical protein